MMLWKKYGIFIERKIKDLIIFNTFDLEVEPYLRNSLGLVADKNDVQLSFEEPFKEASDKASEEASVEASVEASEGTFHRELDKAFGVAFDQASDRASDRASEEYHIGLACVMMIFTVVVDFEDIPW